MPRKSCKKRSLLLLCAALFLLCSCRAEPVAPTEPSETAFDYASALTEYMQGSPAVVTTLTCALATPIELSYTLSATADGGMAAADNLTGQTYTCEAGADTTALLKRACYLPPYDTALSDRNGGKAAVLEGDAVRAFLLSGSNLFDGYEQTPGVTLASPCTYTVYPDGEAIAAYSYEFTLDIADGADSFTAQIKYIIEVEK